MDRFRQLFGEFVQCGFWKIRRSFSGSSGRLVEGIMGVVSGKIKMPGAMGAFP